MSPLRLLQRSMRRNSATHSQGRMSWAETSMGQTLTRAGVFFKKQLWIWPIVAVLILSIIGIYVRSAIESTMKSNLRSQLETLLAAETAMLENWFDVQTSNADEAASDLEFRKSVYALLADNEEATNAESVSETAAHQKAIANSLALSMSTHDFVGYFVTDRSKTIVTSSHSALIGQSEIPEYNTFLNKALDGETLVTAPFPSVVMIKNELGQVRTGEPTMYVCAPIRDEMFQIVGVLALQMRPEREFTQILQLGRIGDSGETYAFNEEGTMVSNSRFDSDLILLGILPDQEQSRSILSVEIRDPQGDMTTGYRPEMRRSQMALTKMAEDAVNGNTGSNVEGYRDYRGVDVVGAWTWMPKHDLGVATEIDVAEAFRPLTILRRMFWALYALLVISAIAIFVFTVIVARLQREARKAAIEAQQLGQYTLEHKLGSGAMGVVYKGHHAMLRRPTAIKLLDADKVDDASIQRFEREVQITCNLNHPSTIAIYDYGRTPEGVFYYAMEYLDGIDLQELVDTYGPQPPSRVIAILLQVCGSLFEAHSQGLVHRDIKPANIMLSRRGSIPDVAKVLDFGLVKATDGEKYGRSSMGTGLTGTPLYMSPESIQTPNAVDGRSDLYGVGAVGYFLLTGESVFKADSLVELCQMQVDAEPTPPSERMEVSISSDLEHAILSCLEKTRAKRPQTARDLAHLLESCPELGDWTTEQGDAWWSKHHRSSPESSSMDTPTRVDDDPPNYSQTLIMEPEE